MQIRTIKYLNIMKKFILILGLLSVSAAVMSQEGNARRWVEVDVSISPYAKTVCYDDRVFSADVAVRYCFSKHFSAGLGVAPSLICFNTSSAGNRITDYIPFYVSLRYEFGEGQKFSPYVIGNVGMSFVQLPDYAYQPRLGLGVSTWITPKVRMFAELSMAFFDDIYMLYTPLSVGFRF